MKKILAFALLLSFAFIFVGCDEKNAVLKGEVVSFGQNEKGEPTFFELACAEKNVGFVITEKTELIFKDQNTLVLLGWSENEDPWDYFGYGCGVNITVGDQTESADDITDKCVSGWFEAEKIEVTAVNEDMFAVDYKPVIYLYPKAPTKVRVNLDYDGKFLCTYPAYNDGWEVTAHPDGRLFDKAGKEYSYLYWEGQRKGEYDFSEGFCVKGEDTALFLEDALEKLGLSRREANEFIVFWLPMMEKNQYNLISFQTQAYTDHARLSVSPAPDAVIRVFMAWKPLTSACEIEPQTLSAPEREGFVVVEWGGSVAR